jgi:hypothetical protein
MLRWPFAGHIILEAEKCKKIKLMLRWLFADHIMLEAEK